MKKEKIPGFDDIVFRERNKEYGAYDIRRRYGSTMSISIVAGLIFGSSAFLVPFYTADHAEYQPGTSIEVIAISDPTLLNPVLPPEAPPRKTPIEAINNVRFIPPDVVLDGQVSGEGVLPADILNRSITDGAATEEVPVDLTGSDPVALIEPEPYVFVKEMPSFPGGSEELMRYISGHIVYPEDAQVNLIEGTVILRFVVGKTGEVSRVEITRSVNALLDDEAVRVISGLPRWKPGKQDGNPVPVWFALPVTFRLK